MCEHFAALPLNTSSEDYEYVGTNQQANTADVVNFISTQYN